MEGSKVRFVAFLDILGFKNLLENNPIECTINRDTFTMYKCVLWS